MVDSIEKLIEEFAKFPGIGKKTAQRMAFFVLKQRKEESEALAQSILDVKEKVRHCSLCFNITEDDPCTTCKDEKRDRSIICVVEEANDVAALEKTNQFKGLYHVLGGVISPLDGVGPDDLKVKELLSQHRRGGNGGLSVQADKTAGSESHPHCPGSACRGRFGICRPDHPGQCTGRPGGVLKSYLQ
jgi:recombination protein RecR